jgi:hypothetical protein
MIGIITVPDNIHRQEYQGAAFTWQCSRDMVDLTDIQDSILRLRMATTAVVMVAVIARSSTEMAIPETTTSEAAATAAATGAITTGRAITATITLVAEEFPADADSNPQ